MRNTRKTVLFIVEGPSDKTALEKIFKTIYKQSKNIAFKFTNGDISSDPSVTVSNVEDRINQIIRNFLDDKKLKRSDIFQVVQIFDMDGVFIPDEAIILGESYSFVYSTQNISCKDVEHAKERNALKREILNHLLSLQHIKEWPYEMYFMSCNLDHALYDEINLDHELKQDYADKFYERFLGKEYLFIEFLKDDVVNGVPDTLSASWRYIKEDLHSLERHTNLHIYFNLHRLPGGIPI